MASHSIGRGKVLLSVSMSVELRDRVAALARRNNKSLSAFCRELLEAAAANEIRLVPQPPILEYGRHYAAHNSADLYVAEGAPPVRKPQRSTAPPEIPKPPMGKPPRAQPAVLRAESA